MTHVYSLLYEKYEMYVNRQPAIITNMTNQPSGKDYSADIERIIEDYLEASTKQAAELDPSYARLWQVVSSLIQAGGKRLRPKLTIMSYQAFGGENAESMLPIAAAQELLHAALLVHDDIIDRDYTRYGVANIAGQYKTHYSQHVSSADSQVHYAHSAAILAGDLLISGAYQLIASSQIADDDKLAAQQLLSQGIFRAAGGELLDTELSFMPHQANSALKVARYKTASYSFALPLLTGAVLAKASSKDRQTLTEFADAIGIAYQLTDDLLGTFGNEEETGKSTVSDITEGKRTFIIESAFELFSPADKEAFMATFGNINATPQEVESAKQLLLSSGAKAKAEAKIYEYAEEAKLSVAKLELDDHYRQSFLDIITSATKRSS